MLLPRLLLLLGSASLAVTTLSDCAEHQPLQNSLQLISYEEENWDCEELMNRHVDYNPNCTNDLCLPEDIYVDCMYKEIWPKFHEWIIIGMHVIVFIVGLVGNALVCIAVYRNHQMRTVTNYFIVNLAVADLLVIVICLPPTIVWDITQTWFLGPLPCKIVLYFQVR
ncbi:hypothetical protein QAD02_000628 [Eretmocerus hayati]|uniref:Uncharacterized protein n=1 Tax=Eretmocerus hayati TaxID=131215 RepID=A0ACC2NDT0_9HYME|nr:hypothetical protein QAD02_000628 [Eretmocerus hayati]